MFSFFQMKKQESGLIAQTFTEADGTVVVNVVNQTCPGYLLSINKAIEKYPVGTRFTLKITYPPCGEDVESYCRQKNIEFLGMEINNEGIYLIQIRK